LRPIQGDFYFRRDGKVIRGENKMDAPILTCVFWTKVALQEVLSGKELCHDAESTSLAKRLVSLSIHRRNLILTVYFEIIKS